MNREIKVENKFTKDTSVFYIETSENTRKNGIIMKEALLECAYKLGCDVSDLELRSNILLTHHE